ncbi:MAG: prephenate dehydratase domain-containing protein [Polyangiaceae bacterium]|nr:prephenate dehydratase domain-containing protein [Polyangiaceae bacterium]
MTEPQDPELVRLRKAMQSLDLEIVGRLTQRAELSVALRKLRERGVNLSASEPNEEAWLEGLSRAGAGVLPKESVRRIFGAVRAEARGLEQLVRVAFMGTEGGFGHELATSYFGSSAELEPAPTAEDALAQVLRGRAGFATFPIESSNEGLVQTSVTALAKTELPIVAERSILANYNLMSLDPGSTIERIFLTPQAHAACERFLLVEYPNVAVVDVRSPLLAAKEAAAAQDAACIVPDGCGKHFGLSALRTNVSEVADLRYRYAIVGTRPAMRTGMDTTCLLFGGDDSPGALYGILGQFAERGINLKKLQSRPREAGGWDYVFYVEVAGHVSDRAVVTALEAVRRSAKYLKVLGSFPSEQ